MSESREFIQAWVNAAKEDLVERGEVWKDFAELAPGPQISSLRAMDIIGWELGRRPREYFTTPISGKDAN